MPRRYKPKSPFNVAMKILVPTTEMIKGCPSTTYSDPMTSEAFNGSFESYGGTENV